MKSKKFNVPYKKGVIDDMSKGSKSINIPLQDRINDEKILNTSYVDDSNGIFIRRMIWCDSPLNEYAIWDKMMNRFNY